MIYVWDVPIRSGSLVGLRIYICFGMLCVVAALSACVDINIYVLGVVCYDSLVGSCMAGMSPYIMIALPAYVL